jgi:type II secretory pathway predicted ATPase ExeA
MKSVLLAFDLDYAKTDRVGLFREFREFVFRQFAANRRVVLIVDEAQNLDTETLETLRMLWNLNDDSNQRLQLFLVGQQELLERLRQADLRQFAQRVTAHYSLEAMAVHETTGYIWHRLKTAGGDSRIFDLGACQEVHAASKGIPRLINMICEMALVYGYAEDRPKIDASVVKEVVDDRTKSGLKSVFFNAN